MTTSASYLIIEETSGIAGSKPRVLQLSGSGLPLAGQVKWGGDSKVTTTWYPGNAIEGSQQQLGPSEMPTQMAGSWTRTQLARSPALYTDGTGAQRRLVAPFDLYAVLDTFRVSGVRLRVTWTVRITELGTPREFSVVREGRLKMLEITPTMVQDLAWNAEFHWTSRGGTQKKVADILRSDDLTSTAAELSDSTADLETLVESRIRDLKPDTRLAADRFTLGKLEALAKAPLKAVQSVTNKIRYNVGQVQRLAGVAKTLRDLPAAIANNAISLAQNTVAVANQGLAELGRTPPEYLTTKRRARDLVNAARYFGNVAGGLERSASSGIALANRYRQAVSSVNGEGQASGRDTAGNANGVLTVYVAKTGDTPERVACKFFEDPDMSEAILRANKLPLATDVFRPGQILVIPRATSTMRAT